MTAPDARAPQFQIYRVGRFICGELDNQQVKVELRPREDSPV